MQSVRLYNKDFIPYISEEEIADAIQKLASDINTDYENDQLFFIAILNGSFMFAAELFKKIIVPAEICFIKVASYKNTVSSGNVVTAIGLDTKVTGKHVIILEDILDTGKTLSAILPQIKDQHPASLRIAALLHKPEAAIHEVKLDYNCFKIPNKFVIGFGLDYNGLGRNYPSLYQLKED